MVTPSPAASSYPHHLNLSIRQVRDVQEAIARAKKAEAEAQRAAQRAASAKTSVAVPGSGSRDDLRALLDADRRERAAQAPVTQGSKAQALPGAGAQIRTAGEAGLNRG